MKTQTLMRSLAGGALLLILALPISAQSGPRGGNNGPRDGRGGPERGGPERGPRGKGELNRVWRDIAALEGGNLALDKGQSAKVVALVLPVSKQSALSETDAKTLAGQIETVLTSAQKAEVEKDHPRGRRGGRGGRDGRPGGPPPRDGQGGPRDGEGRGSRPDGPPRDGEGRGPRPDGPPRMNREDFEKVRPFMEALNPFYPPTGYAEFKTLPADFAKDLAQRYDEGRTLLETLSNRAQGK